MYNPPPFPGLETLPPRLPRLPLPTGKGAAALFLVLRHGRITHAHYALQLTTPVRPTPSRPQFDDAYVAKHHAGQWGSAKEMREALIASTAMQRVQELDKQLEDAVVKVGRGGTGGEG